MLDPSLSVAASVLGAYSQSLPSSGPSQDRLASLGLLDPEEQQRRDEQRQYLWLQRYHAHTEQQRRQGQGEGVSQSMMHRHGPADGDNGHHDGCGHQSMV